MPRKRTSIPENYYAPLPTMLRRLMLSSGYTQADLAAHLGITRQSVSAYMDGSANPTPTAIVNIAGFFGVSTDYLLGVSSYGKEETAHLTAEEIGLSEQAAFVLKSEANQYDKSKLTVLNFLIENDSLLDKLTFYCASAFINVSRNRPFSLIQCDKRNIDSRIYFADIIESLPQFKDAFFNEISKDESAMEQMVFALISDCASASDIDRWRELLLKHRNDPEKGKDEQLYMIAKFLNFCDCLLFRDIDQFISTEGAE